jgi:PAS domain S-box-containing protein
MSTREKSEYEFIFHATDDAVFLVDVEQSNGDYTFTYRRSNDAHERQTGLSKETMRGESPRTLLGDELGADIAENYRRCAEQAETIEYEETLDLPVGTTHWRTKLTPVIEDGTVTKIVGTGRDITDQKRRERELEELSERLELAIDGANLGVWDWDLTTDGVEFNDNWATMLGYDPDEIGSHLDEWERRVHPADIDAVQTALDEHIAGKTEYYDTEHRMQTAEGEWKWIRDVGKIFERDDDGEPLRAVGIHIDIDDRKRTEQALREEREMFAQGPAVVFKWSTEPGWPIEYVSENVEDVLGYTTTELESGEVPFTEVVHNDDLDGVARTVEEHIESGTERFSHDPYRVLAADGSPRWMLGHTKVVREDGDVSHLLGYLVDITKRKQRQESLTDLQRETQQLMEAASRDEAGGIGVHAANVVLDAPMCGVFTPDDDGDRLSAVASVEEATDELDGPPTYRRDTDDDVAAQLVWEVFDSGETRVIDNIETIPELQAQTPAKSACLYALGDHGVFIISATEPEAFDETQKLYFELLAMALERTFDRLDREQQLRDRSRRLSALNDRSRQFSVAGSYDTVAETAINTVREVFDYDGAGVHLIDEYHLQAGETVSGTRLTTDETNGSHGDEVTDTALVPVATDHPDSWDLDEIPALGPDTIAWNVYQDGETYWTQDVHEDDRRHTAETPIRSEMIFPLGRFGVLLIGSTKPGEFDESDVSLCRVLAGNLRAGLQQVNQQRELERSRDLLARTEQLTDAGGWIFDARTETLRWTDGTRAIHDVGEEYDPTLQEAIAFYHPEDRDHIRNVFADCLNEGEPYDVRLRIETAEDELRWVRARGEPVTQEEQVIAVRGTIRDITEQREQRRQIEQQRDNLEFLNEMVRHDVRNNLAIIGAAAETLAEAVDKPDASYVETIQEQVAEATELTRSARDLAEVMLRQDMEQERINLSETIGYEVETIGATYNDATVSVTGEIPNVEVVANDMLQSVFRNLLKNAIQHNDQAEPTVTVSAERTDGHVDVRIADDGPGIAESLKDRMFDQGEKGLDSGGSGIGLYLVDKLVTEFDGEVWAEDNEPRGTVFTVRLPVAESVFGN